MGSKMSYRQQFSSMSDAQSYDEGQYGDGSYGQLLWQIEREQLAAIVAKFRTTHPKIDLLDFATGTGRILSFVESLTDSSIGIDISDSMVERARRRVRRSIVLCRDITTDSQVEGKYDMITAFRFILNAEPDLRRLAFSALRDRLRDRSSVIVFNNHGNLWSHKAVLYPVHMIRRASRPTTAGNYLTHRQVLSLAEDVGLRVQRVHGCAMFGGRLARWVPEQQVLRWERALAASSISRVGGNQIYLARLA
jgi:SAM-dependent methyltransferase